MASGERDVEGELRRELALWRAIEESMPVGLAAIDLEGAQIYVNRAFTELVDFRADELLGALPPYPYWPAEERQRIEEAFRTTLRGEAPSDGFELRFARRSGERFDALVSIAPLRGEGGELRGWLASTFDITERARARDVLAARAHRAMEDQRLLADAERARAHAEASAERLRILAEASNTMAAALDDDDALRALARVAVESVADYCVTYAYDADDTIRRVGLAHRDPAKRSVVDDLVRAGAPRISDAFGAGAVIRTGQPIWAADIDGALLARAVQNGAHRAVLDVLGPRSSIVVPLAARGRTLGAMAMAATAESGRRYDADDLIFAEQLAARAALLVDNARLYREAQAAVGARDDMVAAVSHDLRNPLQVILNAVELAYTGHDKHAPALDAIARSAEQMKRFVHGLLDIARIQAGRIALELAPLDLGPILDEALALHAPLADAKSVRLELARDAALPSLRADANGIRQVLANLIGNALKFAPEGGAVRIGATCAPEHVRIAIADDGPGIAPDHVPHLFDRFWQGEDAAQRGSGLGLAIAKGIVDAHGGTIRVESTLGMGATFEILLPFDAVR